MDVIHVEGALIQDYSPKALPALAVRRHVSITTLRRKSCQAVETRVYRSRFQVFFFDETSGLPFVSAFTHVVLSLILTRRVLQS